MMKRILGKITIIIFLVSLITVLFQNNSYALNPNVPKVTSEDEIKDLLGTTSAQSRKDYLLGLAREYSVFVEDNFTIHDAETGGKIAVGGKLEATTDYKYQVGSGLYNYRASEHSGKADVVVGNGPIKNIETQYGATIEGENYDMKKKIVVSEDATSMNWDDFSAEELETFVQANAINFSDEFEYLRQVSNNLAEYPTKGECVSGEYITKGNANPFGQLYSPSDNVSVFRR